MSNFVSHFPPTTTETQEFFTKVVQLGLNFKTQRQVKRDLLPIPETKSFGPIPTQGMSYDELIGAWQEIANTSSNWASPNFMGFPDAGNAAPALGAALLIPFLNQNLANQDICAPSASFVEMEVVHWLRQQLGFVMPGVYSKVSDIGGVLTLGGCLSNTIALMAAREHLFPGAGRTGIPVQAQRIKVLVPEIVEHYSIRSAMGWISLGEENIVRIPVDENFRMRLGDLGRCIDEERAKYNYVLACVAYAGDSRTMCVDDLVGIADLLQRKNVWFHVDACHGIQLAFSTKHRHHIRGIDKADSVTVDPHKVLWIPNTCSFVLFDPRVLANISTNSDLILKTQWSIGQITPCIGSKAFDALKLWSIIRFFGKSGIEQFVDARLALTGEIQAEIGRRADLVLLNETDINSCIFLFIPHGCQKGGELSAADVEKISAADLYIKSRITEVGEFYLHGFMLKRCPHWILPDCHPVYVLRTMNGNPLTTMANVNALVDQVIFLGQQFITDRGYKISLTRPSVDKLSVSQKLKIRLAGLLEGVDHAALVYGSSTCFGNSLLSDIDVMVFAADDFSTAENTKKLIEAFKQTMVEEGVMLDAEVPFERKLVIPISFASQTIESKNRILVDSKIPSIVKSMEYLSSDHMLSGLVLNVLTVPHSLLCGSNELVNSLYKKAEETLISLVETANGGHIFDADDFVQKAQTDGVRSGEEFLGYKCRPETLAHLRAIYTRRRPAPQVLATPTIATDSNAYPSVLFLNGFPGVGKFSIAREVHKRLAASRLLDNHLLIDAAQAIEPNRSPAHYALRTSLRHAAFNGYKAVEDKFVTLILTSCSASTLPHDVEVFAEFVDIARVRGVPFMSVNIVCDERENVERLKNDERSVGKGKLMDGQVLLDMRKKHMLLDASACKSAIAGVKLYHMELDTTRNSVQQSADKVMEFLRVSSSHVDK